MKIIPVSKMSLGQAPCGITLWFSKGVSGGPINGQTEMLMFHETPDENDIVFGKIYAMIVALDIRTAPILSLGEQF